MRFASISVLAATIAGLTCAAVIRDAPLTAAVIVSTRSSNGLGYTNTTIAVPLDEAYTNKDVLDTVSTLYVDSPAGTTCTAYTDASNQTFTADKPLLLSTNTVVVNLLECCADS
ncbi:hypothetical protein F5Y16DRAFT_225536 [Xylariaceae sp. FL0255]|nr:hypothetical protein F5Y16DRAFT_225536 [Xylariaceae sp. FL0255]